MFIVRPVVMSPRPPPPSHAAPRRGLKCFAALITLLFAGEVARAANVVPNAVVATPAAGATLTPGTGSTYSGHRLVVPPGAVLQNTGFAVSQTPAGSPERWPQRATYAVSPGVGSPPEPFPLLAAASLRGEFKSTDIPPGFTASDMRLYRATSPTTLTYPPPATPPDAWVELEQGAHTVFTSPSLQYVETVTSLIYNNAAAMPTIVHFVQPAATCVAGPDVIVKVDLTDWNVLLAAPQGGFTAYTVTVNGVVAARLDLPANPQRFTATLTLSNGPHILRARVTDAANDRCFEDRTITVDGAPPIVAAGPTPTGCINETLPILRATFVDPVGGCGLTCSTATVTVLPEYPVPQPVSCIDGVLQWQPGTPLGEGAHAAEFRVQDAVGNVGAAPFTFSVDIQPPDIAGRFPAPDSCTKDTPLVVRATWSDPCVVDSSNVQVLLIPVGGLAQDVTTSCAINDTGMQCTLAPPVHDKYDVEVVGLRDVAGNVLSGGDALWRFAYDTKAPLVSAQSPTACTNDSPLVVTASWSDDCGVLTDQLQVLFGPSGGVLGDVTTSCTYDTTHLECSLTAPTVVDDYTVRLVHLRDSVGNERDPVMDPEEWTFGWDDEAPVITATAPVTCVDGVPMITISATWDDGAGCGAVFDGADPVIVVNGGPIPHVDMDLTLTTTGFTYTKAYSSDVLENVSIINLSDQAGNLAPIYSWTFEVDRGAPGVTAEMPVANSVVTSALHVSGDWQEGCAGVDLSTVVVTVSGNPCVMDAGEPTTDGFRCTPTLGPGPLQHVVVSASDTMSHGGGRSWDFTIGNCLSLARAERPLGTTVTAVKLGSVVSLIGTCISNGATVDFDGQQIETTTFVSSTQLDFTVPPGARGGLVRIINPDGQASNSIALRVIIADGLSNISGLALGADNMIYVANQGTGEALSVDPETGQVTVVGVELTPKGMARDPSSAIYFGSNQDPDADQETANRLHWFRPVAPTQPDAEWTTSTVSFTRTQPGGLAIDPVTFATFPRVFEASTAESASGFDDGRVLVRSFGTDSPAPAYSTPLWPGATTVHVGMAFDRTGTTGATSQEGVGNLYVSSGSLVRKIPPHPGPGTVLNVTVATGIFGAAGLDWHPGLDRLLVTSTTGRLWLVDPALPTTSNKAQVYLGLSQSRYGLFDTLHRAWDPPLGSASLGTNATQVIVAEPTRVLSVRFGVPIQVDSVVGTPVSGPLVTDEFAPALGEILTVRLSGGQVLAGDQVTVQLVRLHDDPLGGEANASHLIHDMGTFDVGPSGDIIPDGSGNWTYETEWNGQCAGSSCYDCDAGGCPDVTRTSPAGRKVKIRLAQVPAAMRPGQYVVRARLQRNGFVLGEANHDAFVPTLVQFVARWNPVPGGTWGNLHTNMVWMGLATTSGLAPGLPEELAARATFLERLTDFTRTTVGLDTARIRWLPPVDDPAQPWIFGAITVLIGGDKIVVVPSDRLCGVTNIAPPPTSCTNAFQNSLIPILDVWTGHLVDVAGSPLEPFPECGACSGVAHVFAQGIAPCQPLPAVWDGMQPDVYYEVARHFSPAYAGTPLASGEWPPSTVPTSRQVAAEAYLDAFARHAAMTAAHELGHQLGVPENGRVGECATGDSIHNTNLDRSAPPNTSFVTRDTQHDVMDGGGRWLYTADAGIVGYTYPGPLLTSEENRAGFQDAQCDANDSMCPPGGLLPFVHPFSHDDLQVGNR